MLGKESGTSLYLFSKVPQSGRRRKKGERRVEKEGEKRKKERGRKQKVIFFPFNF